MKKHINLLHVREKKTTTINVDSELKQLKYKINASFDKKNKGKITYINPYIADEFARANLRWAIIQSIQLRSTLERK